MQQIIDEELKLCSRSSSRSGGQKFFTIIFDVRASSDQSTYNKIEKNTSSYFSSWWWLWWNHSKLKYQKMEPLGFGRSVKMIWLKWSLIFFSRLKLQLMKIWQKQNFLLLPVSLNFSGLEEAKFASKINHVQWRWWWWGVRGGWGGIGFSQLSRVTFTPAPSCAWLMRSRSRRRCRVGKRRARRGRPSRSATSRRTSSRWTTGSRRRCRSARTRRWSVQVKKFKLISDDNL